MVERAEVLERQVEISPRWNKKEFAAAMAAARDFNYQVRVTPAQLAEIDGFLSSKRTFLLRLLENPNLLEHERFTDLLWAVFHASEELDIPGKELRKPPQK